MSTLRTFKQCVAKKDSDCRGGCGSGWKEGETAYLVIDPIEDKICLMLCLACGDKAKQTPANNQLNKSLDVEATIPVKKEEESNISIRLLNDILNELKKISLKLKVDDD